MLIKIGIGLAGLGLIGFLIVLLVALSIELVVLFNDGHWLAAMAGLFAASFVVGLATLLICAITDQE